MTAHLRVHKHSRHVQTDIKGTCYILKCKPHQGTTAALIGHIFQPEEREIWHLPTGVPSRTQEQTTSPIEGCLHQLGDIELFLLV